MSYKNFRSVETREVLTLPNIISVARGIGGIVLGAQLARHAIEPLPAFVCAVGLGVSDLEGSLIEGFDWLSTRARRVGQAARFIRDKLRIVPSAFGRIADTAGDKLYAMGALAGSMVGGYLPSVCTTPMLVAEAATVSVTLHATHLLGREPDAPKNGKNGFVARATVIGSGLLAAGTDGRLHTALEATTYAGTVAAVGFAVASCADIHRQATDPVGAEHSRQFNVD